MYCSACGAAVAQGLSYCNHCGAKLKGEGDDGKSSELSPELLVSAMVGVGTMGRVATAIQDSFLESSVDVGESHCMAVIGRTPATRPLHFPYSSPSAARDGTSGKGDGTKREWIGIR